MTTIQRSLKVKNFAGQSLSWLTIQPHTIASGMLAKWFEEETGVKINIVAVPYVEITDDAIKDVSNETREFDVFQYWYAMLGTLVQKDILCDISTWWVQNTEVFNPQDIIPVFRDTWCLINNKRYGVPFDGDMHLLFYNKILFNKHGLQPPNTWDEYLVAARKITEAEIGNDRYGCGIMAANIPLILVGTYLNRLAGFGGDFFDFQGKPALDSPEALAALEHLVAELPYALPDPAHVAFDEMLGPWMAGRVGMVEFWADLGKITDTKESTIANQWGVLPLPKGPAPKGKVTAPLNAGWSLGVSSKARNPELAMEFLKFCLRPDIILKICTIQGGLDPVRWSTYEKPELTNCVTKELATAACSAIKSTAVPWPTSALWSELQTILNDNLYLAVTHVKTPRQALDDIQNKWNQILL
jgi:multiple sugar transport system substrate-binding protein